MIGLTDQSPIWSVEWDVDVDMETWNRRMLTSTSVDSKFLTSGTGIDSPQRIILKKALLLLRLCRRHKALLEANGVEIRKWWFTLVAHTTCSGGTAIFDEDRMFGRPQHC